MHTSEVNSGHSFLEMLKEQSSKKNIYFDDVFDQLDKKARARGIPLSAQFELTPLCNFDCKMCYSHLSGDQMQSESLLTVDQWKQIIDGAYAAGLMRVILTGGECLTYPGFKDLYLYLHSLGCEIRVLTNGSLLDDNWISFFQAHPPILIQISLYGYDEDSYERVTGHRMFSAVSTNIRKVIAARLPVSLAITPSRYMGKGILDTIRFANTFNIPYSMPPFLIDPKEETGRSGLNHSIDIDLYVEACKLCEALDGKNAPSIDPEMLPAPGGPCQECDLLGLPCSGGMSRYDIDWNGAMYICNYNRSVICHPLTEGFLPSWNRIHQAAANWKRVAECIGCPYEEVCVPCEIRKAKFGKNGQQVPFVQCDQTKRLVQHGVHMIQEHI